MSSQMSSLLFLVVGISMALTPWLAAGGQLIASRFELHDVRNLLPVESEVSSKTINCYDVMQIMCFHDHYMHCFLVLVSISLLNDIQSGKSKLCYSHLLFYLFFLVSSVSNVVALIL